MYIVSLSVSRKHAEWNEMTSEMTFKLLLKCAHTSKTSIR